MHIKNIVMIGAATASIALVTYAFVLAGGSDASPSSAPSASAGPGTGTPLATRHHDSSSVASPRRFAPPRMGVGARPTSSAEDSPPGMPSEAEIAEILRNEQAREDAFVAQFDAETVDARWATRWESGITAALDSSLGSLPGFGGVTIECRQQRCFAEASWDDYATATLALSAAADVTKGACATSVFMPPPDDPGAPYRHTLRFSSCQDAPS